MATSLRIAKKPKPTKKLLIVGLVAMLVVGAGVGVYWKFFRHHEDNIAVGTVPGTRPVNSVDYGPPTAQDKQAVDQHKQEIVQQEQQSQNPPSSSISVTISRASQAGAGQPLNIRSIVEGATSGSCTAALSYGNTNFQKAGSITLQATSYVCNIDVPASDFAAAGTWKLSLTATSGNLVSQGATQTVTIAK